MELGVWFCLTQATWAKPNSRSRPLESAGSRSATTTAGSELQPTGNVLAVQRHPPAWREERPVPDARPSRAEPSLKHPTAVAAARRTTPRTTHRMSSLRMTSDAPERRVGVHCR